MRRHSITTGSVLPENIFASTHQPNIVVSRPNAPRMKTLAISAMRTLRSKIIQGNNSFQATSRTFVVCSAIDLESVGGQGESDAGPIINDEAAGVLCGGSERRGAGN